MRLRSCLRRGRAISIGPICSTVGGRSRQVAGAVAPAPQAQYMWNRSSLANVLLLSCLGDRTEMAHSVEARTPFLDRHLTNGGDDVRWKSAGSALRSMTEKWILREAARPYTTEKLYQRKKHTFLTPTKWPRDGALRSMFRTLLTRRAVEDPGFVDHGDVKDEVKRAFGDEADAKSSRVLCYVGSWVTLAQRFGAKKASTAIDQLRLRTILRSEPVHTPLQTASATSELPQWTARPPHYEPR
ncbi:hypothetical protein LZ32DRAFT_659600 [Colletotrichum eremochloae]|nr:hypothetical protein LZ32DRAFT_659600 [Colletotrichum eremochloae]